MSSARRRAFTLGAAIVASGIAVGLIMDLADITSTPARVLLIVAVITLVAAVADRWTHSRRASPPSPHGSRHTP